MMTIEELKDLVLFARQQGITYLEYDGLKAHLGENLPNPNNFGKINEDEIASSPLESPYIRMKKARERLERDLLNL